MILYRARFGVPSNGVVIYSDSDFDSPEQAQAMLDPAMEDGSVTDYKIYKVTTITTEELVYER